MKLGVVRITTTRFYALAGTTLIWPKIASKTKKENLDHLYQTKGKKSKLAHLDLAELPSSSKISNLAHSGLSHEASKAKNKHLANLPSK